MGVVFLGGVLVSYKITRRIKLVWKIPTGTGCCWKCGNLTHCPRKWCWAVFGFLKVYYCMHCNTLEQQLSGDYKSIQLGCEEQMRKGTDGDIATTNTSVCSTSYIMLIPPFTPAQPSELFNLSPLINQFHLDCFFSAYISELYTNIIWSH